MPGWEGPGVSLRLQTRLLDVPGLSNIFSHQIFWELVGFFLQALNLKPLNTLLPAEWNQVHKQPLEKWLLHKESQEDNWKSRVHCCGNIVVPAQAAAALQVVGRMPTFSWIVQNGHSKLETTIIASQHCFIGSWNIKTLKKSKNNNTICCWQCTMADRL